MSELSFKIPKDWKLLKFAEVVSYTAKPKHYIQSYPIDFIPMELISEQKLYITQSEKKRQNN